MILPRLDRLPVELIGNDGIAQFLVPSELSSYRLTSRRINSALNGQDVMVQAVIKNSMENSKNITKFFSAECLQGREAVSNFFKKIPHQSFVTLFFYSTAFTLPAFTKIQDHEQLLNAQLLDKDFAIVLDATDAKLKKIFLQPITTLHIHNVSQLTQEGWDLISNSSVTDLTLHMVNGPVNLRSNCLTNLTFKKSSPGPIDLIALPSIRELVLDNCENTWTLNAPGVPLGAIGNKTLEKLTIKNSAVIPQAAQLNFRIVELCIDSLSAGVERLKIFSTEVAHNFVLEKLTIQNCQSRCFSLNYPVRELRLIDTDIIISYSALENLEILEVTRGEFRFLQTPIPCIGLKVLKFNYVKVPSNDIRRLINSTNLEEIELIGNSIASNGNSLTMLSSNLKRLHIANESSWKSISVLKKNRLQTVSISQCEDLTSVAISHCDSECSIYLRELLDLKELILGDWRSTFPLKSLSIVHVGLSNLVIDYCNLENLHLYRLPRLRELRLPSSLRYLNVQLCPDIREFQGLSQSKDLEFLQLQLHDERTMTAYGEYPHLKSLILNGQPIPNIEAAHDLERICIPLAASFFNNGVHPNLTHLTLACGRLDGDLDLSSYAKLATLDLFNIDGSVALISSNVTTLNIKGGKYETLDINNLHSLKNLQIEGATISDMRLADVPLEYLSIVRANESLLNCFSNLFQLKTVHLRGCDLEGFSFPYPLVTHLILEECTGSLDLTHLASAMFIEIKNCPDLQSIRQAEDTAQFQLRELLLDGVFELNSLSLADYPFLSQIRIVGDGLHHIELRNLPRLVDVLLPGSNTLKSVHLEEIPYLQEVRLMDSNTFASLAVRNCPKFLFNDLNVKSYSSLDISGALSTYTISLKHPLKTLSISSSDVRRLSLECDQLTQLVSDCPALEFADINADLSRIDLSHSPNLLILNLKGKNIQECELHNMALLESLSLTTPLLSLTKFPNLSALISLILVGLFDEVFSFELPALRTLTIRLSPLLTTLDLSRLSKLERVQLKLCPCLSTIIQSSDVSACPLKTFILDELVELENLELIGYPDLEVVNILNGNGNIKLARLPALSFVTFLNNQYVQGVTLQENEQLEKITIKNEPLQELIVNNCPNFVCPSEGYRTLSLSGNSNAINPILNINNGLLTVLRLENSNYTQVLFNECKLISGVYLRNMRVLNRVQLEHLSDLSIVRIANCPRLLPPIIRKKRVQHLESDSKWRTFLLHHPYISMHIRSGIIPVIQEIAREVLVSIGLSCGGGYALRLMVKCLQLTPEFTAKHVFIPAISMIVLGVLAYLKFAALPRISETYNRYRTAINNDEGIQAYWEMFLRQHPHIRAYNRVWRDYREDLEELVLMSLINPLVTRLVHSMRPLAYLKYFTIISAVLPLINFLAAGRHQAIAAAYRGALLE